MIVILANSLSVSYFTYSDEYWTVYYVKPYSRLPVFVIGVVAGCSYFSFKKEENACDEQRVPKVLVLACHIPQQYRPLESARYMPPVDMVLGQ